MDIHAISFLTALFEQTLDVIHEEGVMTRLIENCPSLDTDQKQKAKQELEEMPNLSSKFRLFMTVGQSFSSQGGPRKNFYREVIWRANEVRPIVYLTFHLIVAIAILDA
jgi:hypothetical protein